MVGVAELESATPCVSCKCSNQLSYTPVEFLKSVIEHYLPFLTRLFFNFFTASIDPLTMSSNRE